jgi:hypothetical protein
MTQHADFFTGDIPMTQMLLFDSATQPKDTTVAVTAPTVKQDEPENIATAVQHDSGLNHMGDLARLVLMRYELVAKRRAAMAARKARPGS